MTKGLRALREERHLTQKQLAVLSGVDQACISLLELNPDPNPLWYTARRLARALRLKPHEIFNEREARP